MSYSHKLDDFTPWSVERYEMHDNYSHGESRPNERRPAISVAQYARGPDAVVLERALFLNGYTKLFMTPEDDQDHDAPRSEDRQSWLDMPQVKLTDTRIVLANGGRADDTGTWPATPERIDVEVVWTLNGGTKHETLRTDLGFGRTDLADPRYAYPYVTSDSKLTAETLEKLILVAYSRDDLGDPYPSELEEHRATARATADIVLPPRRRLADRREASRTRTGDQLPAGRDTPKRDQDPAPRRAPRAGQNGELQARRPAAHAGRNRPVSEPGAGQPPAIRRRTSPRIPRRTARDAHGPALDPGAENPRDVQRGARRTPLGTGESDQRKDDESESDHRRTRDRRGSPRRHPRRRVNDRPRRRGHPAM